MPATLTVGTPVNVSLRADNQAETSIAINPTNPLNLFQASNLDTGSGMQATVSIDGGTTWSRRTIAGGGDGLPVGCCDPSAVFDDFGNLYFTYLSDAADAIIVTLSTNGGTSFTSLGAIATGSVDQPTVVVGPGQGGTGNTVWVSFRGTNGLMSASGATVTGLGVISSFSTPQDVPGSANGNFGDIVVGPNGQVMISYQTPVAGEGPSTIQAHLDPDGLGVQPFGAAIVMITTNVGGFDAIPAQPNRTVDAESGLVWDRSGGLFHGRVYMVYTEESPSESNDLDIFVISSDDDGANWSLPIPVNDDTGTNSQFLPRMALDQTTGNLAVSWYDARNDAAGNNDVQFFASLSTDGGSSFLSNVAVSGGSSNATLAGFFYDFEFGDYTGLDFFNNVFYPSWSDNSNSTGDNPPIGFERPLDIYTTRVTVDSSPIIGLPTVSIFPSDANAAEPTNSGSFVISRTGDTTAALVVNLAIGGTAITGTDYSSVTSPVTIPAGFVSTTINITPIDDLLGEGTETVVLSIATGATYEIATSSSGTVNITDNEIAGIIITDSVLPSDDFRLSFGGVKVGTNKTEFLIIQNTTTQTRTITSWSAASPFFLTPTNLANNAADDIVLAPLANVVLAVTFLPSDQLVHRSNVFILTDDPDQPTITVAVDGNGQLADLVQTSNSNNRFVFSDGNSFTNILYFHGPGQATVTFTPDNHISTLTFSGTTRKTKYRLISNGTAEVGNIANDLILGSGLGDLVIEGNVDDLALTSSTSTINNIVIEGNVAGGSISGAVSLFQAGTLGLPSKNTLNFSSSIRTLRIGGNAAGNINIATTAGSPGNLGLLSVGGNAANLNVSVNGNIGSVRVVGDVTGQFIATGNISSITGQSISALISAGFGLDGLRNSDGTEAAATIGKILTTGKTGTILGNISGTIQATAGINVVTAANRITVGVFGGNIHSDTFINAIKARDNISVAIAAVGRIGSINTASTDRTTDGDLTGNVTAAAIQSVILEGLRTGVITVTPSVLIVDSDGDGK